MEYTHSIVVVDGKGGNPAKLHTQLEPIRFDKDMSMAITTRYLMVKYIMCTVVTIKYI